MPHYWNDGIWEINGRKNVGTNTGVQFHFFEFSGRECAWLVQNVFWYCQFPHVMEQRGCFDSLYLCGVFDSNRASQSCRIMLNSPDMPVCNLILRVDCH